MKKHRLSAVAAVILGFALAAPVAAQPKDLVQRVDNSAAILQQMVSNPETGIPQRVLAKAYGVAIIPGVVKAGLLVGGQHGKGVALVRHGTSWSDPIFVSLTGGSVGAQIGVETLDVILVFNNAKGMSDLLEGKFKLGTSVSTAAGPMGTKRGEEVDVYSYTRTSGLFAGVSVTGSSLTVDNDADRAFYNKPAGIGPSQIFDGQGITTPPAAARLRSLLDRYTTAKPMK